MNIEDIAAAAVHWGYLAHKELGPGLLESVCETVIAKSLEKNGFAVVQQHPVSFEFDGITFKDGVRRVVNTPRVQT